MPARHSAQPPVGCGLSPLWLPDAVKAHSLCLFTRCPSTEAVCHPATAAISLPGDGQGPLRPARRYRLQTDRLRSTRAPDDVTIHGYSQHVNPVIGHRGLDVGGKPNRPLADLGDARPVAIVNSKQSTMWNITILRARLWSVALSPRKCSCHIGNKTQVGLQRVLQPQLEREIREHGLTQQDLCQHISIVGGHQGIVGL